MTGDELKELLAAAERTPGWLGAKLTKTSGGGLSRTHVMRWVRGEREVPERYIERIRLLLPPVPR